jgi:hypothetical protein
MSAIGGSGGNGGDSNPLGMLQGILDPLGLVQGLVGGIGKLFQGDTSGLDAMGKTMMNKVSAFSQEPGKAQGQGGMGGFDPSQTAAQTGWLPPQNQQNAGQGFAPESAAQQEETPSHSDAEADHSDRNSQRASSSSAQTGTTNQSDSAQENSDRNSQRASSSSAQTGTIVPPAMDPAELAAKQAEFEALNTVQMNFSYAFDQLGLECKDGFFHKGNLEKVAWGPPPGTTDEMRKAAKYLLAHPEVMAVLQRNSGEFNQGTVSLAAVANRALELKLEIKNATATPPPAPTTPVVNQAPGQGMTIVPVGNGTTPLGGGAVIAGQGGPTQYQEPAKNSGNAGNAGNTQSTANTHTNVNPSGANAKTLEDCLRNIGNSMDKKEQDLINLMKTGSAGDIAVAQQELTRINQQYKQMYELIGNLRQTFHDMSMHSIGHIR